MGSGLSSLCQEDQNPNIRHFGRDPGSEVPTAEQTAAYLQSIIEHLPSPKCLHCFFKMNNVEKARGTDAPVYIFHVNSCKTVAQIYLLKTGSPSSQEKY